MKAFNEFGHALARPTGLILLLTEKSAPQTRNLDEHSQTDILTLGLNLAPAFPNHARGPVAMGVCNPLQWRNRPRFARGSLTSGCDTKMNLSVHRFQRTLYSYAAIEFLPRSFFSRPFEPLRSSGVT